MIIDMHTHVYPEKIAKRAVEKLSKAADIPAQSNGMKSGLQESMKRAGVDYSLLLPVATSVKQVDKMNQEAVAANECAGETGLLSFGAIHPDTPDYKEVLSWLADHDVRGIKLHPDYQGTFLMISAWSASLIRPQNWGFIQWYTEGSILDCRIPFTVRRPVR